jgi:3',5'-nucleoside bisphosphate phosphatase
MTADLRRADLHVHSTASDGSLSPAEVVRAAARRLDIIALTDHDTVVGFSAARAEARHVGSVTVIPGIEVSSTHGDHDVHVLGYFIDPEHDAIGRHAKAARERRQERLVTMGRRLQEIGVAVTEEEVRATATGTNSPGRPHLARLLVDKGLVRSHAEAFDLYLGNRAPAYEPIELLTPHGAIELIRAAGGVAVWAHPPVATLERDLPGMVEWGLEGIECFRPQTSPDDRRRLLTLARRYDLMTTGGSDWHGAWQGAFGEFGLGVADIAALLKRGGLD